MKLYIYVDNNCYHVVSKKTMGKMEINIIKDILRHQHSGPFVIREKRITRDRDKNKIEIGPLRNFSSPWCSNAVSIVHKCGINTIISIEKTRFVDKEDAQYDMMTECIYEANYKANIINNNPRKNHDYYLFIDNLVKYNKRYKYGFDKYDIIHYKKIFSKYQRDPTNVELFDLAQSNSEHSRHWTFISKLCHQINKTDSIRIEHTLFDLIKSTLHEGNNGNSVLAFCDNSSAIRGNCIQHLAQNVIQQNIYYELCASTLHPVLTAETHNFPTGIAPFPGAATGIGGRIRDNLAVGRGGLIIAGTAGYSVGNLHLENYKLPWEIKLTNIQTAFKSSSEILIEASNGASDYGNKFGEPIILGFTRSFDNMIKINGNREQRIGYIKPIMFTAGIGQMREEHTYKQKLDMGYIIVRVGGPVYKIGMGGGTASSRNQEIKNKEIDFSAVQRGDPEMENKVYKFIRTCIDMGDKNPILSIHDQGAGGMANTTKELVEPNGAVVCLNNVILGDNTLTNSEIWSSEHQEQVSIIIHPKDSSLIKTIAQRENVPISFFGYITNSGMIEVYDKDNPITNYPVQLVLEDIGSSTMEKKIKMYENRYTLDTLSIPYTYHVKTLLYNVLRLVTVGSKRFLTNKVDRSVSGLIVQQQCVGPYHTPLSNVAVVAHSHFDTKGIASSIGEQPLKGIIDYGCMARLTVAEMLTNLMWAEVSAFEDIKCSGNWMWALKDNPEEYHNLYCAVKEVTDFLKLLGIAIDGGKDSLSMTVRNKHQTIKSPNTLVLSSYVSCPNIYHVVTPELKKEDSVLIYINMGGGKYRLGGSALSQTIKHIGNECPDITNASVLKDVFLMIQRLLKEERILSGHDVSDGGLITTCIEMAIAGDIGCNIDITKLYNTYTKQKNYSNKAIDIYCLFSEEVGIIIEVSKVQVEYIEKCLKTVQDICYCIIGVTKNEKNITVQGNGGKFILNETLHDVRYAWEETSYHLELMQTNHVCVQQEREMMKHMKPPCLFINEKVIQVCNHFETELSKISYSLPSKPIVAVIREEGSNGEREMAAAFYMSGFDVVDVTINDFIHTDNPILPQVRGVAFVGGFSYSDVFGAGVGWYSVIKNNKKVYQEFNDFYNRTDTFSLGVCNGSQLMAHLKWVPGNCRFVKNKSERFESRFSTVKIRKSPSIMLKNMVGCVMGVWVAHGEGRCIIEDRENMHPYTPIQYVDTYFNSTENYPFNPNGSENGITAVCSKDGRHLAMMPHPERCFMNWQLPWVPSYYPLAKEGKSPWAMMFYNAYQWCCSS